MYSLLFLDDTNLGSSSRCIGIAEGDSVEVEEQVEEEDDDDLGTVLTLRQ